MELVEAAQISNETQDMELVNLNDPTKFFSNWEGVGFFVLMAVLSTLGIVTNSFTLIVLSQMEKTFFNIFLISLCVSDLVSAIVSNFWAYRVTYGIKEFALPQVVCQLTVAVDHWTTFVTVMHIWLLCLFRLVSIKRPFMARHITPFLGKVVVSAAWFLVTAVVLWAYILSLDVENASKRKIGYACAVSDQWLRFFGQYYRYFLFPVFYLLPMVGILISTSMTIKLLIERKRKKLHNTSSSPQHIHTTETSRPFSTLTTNSSNNFVGGRPDESTGIRTISKTSEAPSVHRPSTREKESNRAVIQLLLILVSFLFGYLPDIALRVGVFTQTGRGGTFRGRPSWMLCASAHLAVRLSECCNPFVYNLGSSKLRAASTERLKRWFHCRRTENNPAC